MSACAISAASPSCSGSLTVADADPGQATFAAQSSPVNGKYGTWTVTVSGDKASWTYTLSGSASAAATDTLTLSPGERGIINN